MSAEIPAFAIAADQPDAELLALGAELELIIQEWLAQSDIDAQIENAYYEMTKQEFEIVQQEYWAEMERTGDVWEHIHERMDPLIENILSHNLRTVVGIGVQARAMRFNRNLSDTEHLEPFLTSVCAVAGV